MGYYRAGDGVVMRCSRFNAIMSCVGQPDAGRDRQADTGSYLCIALA